MKKKLIFTGILSLMVLSGCTTNTTTNIESKDLTKAESEILEENSTIKNLKTVEVEQNEMLVNNLNFIGKDNENGYYVTPISYTTFDEITGGFKNETYKPKENNVFLVVEFKVENKDTKPKNLLGTIGKKRQILFDNGYLFESDINSEIISNIYEKELNIKSVITDTINPLESVIEHYYFEVNKELLEKENFTVQLALVDISENTNKDKNPLDFVRFVKK